MRDRRAFGGIWSVVLCGVFVYALVQLWPVVLPFLLGLGLAYVLEPFVEGLEASGLRRDRVVVLFYLAFLALMVGLVWFVVPLFVRQMNGIIDDFPHYLVQINAMIDTLNASVSRYVEGLTGHSLKTSLVPYHLDQFLLSLMSSLPTRLLGVAHLGMWIVIIPFVSFYGVLQGPRWINALFNATPSAYVESLLGLLAEVNATLGGYLRGQMLDSLCVGTVTTLGLWLLGVDQYVLIGVITGVLNPIPFVAPAVGGFLAFFLGYANGLPPSTLVAILVFFVLVRLLDDFVFIPFIVGHSVQLHPAMMLFAVLAGFECGGLLGLIFAIPVAAVLKIFLSIALHQRQKNILTSVNSVFS